MELENKVNSIAKSVESTLSSNNMEFGNKVNNLAKSIESTLAQSKPPPAWEIPAAFTPSSVAINVADELSERDKRKCIIVVHNLPETPTPSSQADINLFLEICQKSFDLNIEVIKSVRLGQKQDPTVQLGQKKDPKPRSLLYLSLTVKHHETKSYPRLPNSDFQVIGVVSTSNQT